MDRELERRTAEQDADPRVDLAVQRTALAEDRTLLAWLRTAIALMGAGVAFDKGTQLLHEERLVRGTALVQNGHVVGRSMTAISTILLLFVLWEHRKTHRELARIKGTRPPGMQTTVIACVLVILLGVSVFVVLLFSN
jgi:putative membrane protein